MQSLQAEAKLRLLEITQRKLLQTLQEYQNLNLHKNKFNGSREECESLLQKLRTRIKRFSDKQSRFKLGITGGNLNIGQEKLETLLNEQQKPHSATNVVDAPTKKIHSSSDTISQGLKLTNATNQTLPCQLQKIENEVEISKEEFLEALGLVTKEALIKLQSKSSERKRRKTANPRFSHEAIQAKQISRAIQLAVIKRSSERVQKQVSLLKKSENSLRSTPQNINNATSSNNNDRKQTNTRSSKQKVSSQNSVNTNANNNRRLCSDDNNATSTLPNKSFSTKTKSQNANKRHRDAAYKSSCNDEGSKPSNSKVVERNQRGNLSCAVEERKLLHEKELLTSRLGSLRKMLKSKEEANERLLKENENIRKLGLDIVSVINLFGRSVLFEEDIPQVQNYSQQTAEPLDIWIDMKCEESLNDMD